MNFGRDTHLLLDYLRVSDWFFLGLVHSNSRLFINLFLLLWRSSIIDGLGSVNDDLTLRPVLLFAGRLTSRTAHIRLARVQHSSFHIFCPVEHTQKRLTILNAAQLAAECFVGFYLMSGRLRLCFYLGGFNTILGLRRRQIGRLLLHSLSFRVLLLRLLRHWHLHLYFFGLLTRLVS